MEVFSHKTSIDFLGKRKLAAVISATLIIVSLIAVIPAVRGLNFGIDFTGGVLLELSYPQAANLPAIREQLAAGGFGDALVQNFGTARDVMVRVLPRADLESKRVAEQIMAVLQAAEPAVELRRTEFVGPQVGEELTEQGSLAMLFALLMITIYVMLRYQWKFAVGAIVATLHDPIITLGVFAIFQIPFDLSVLAAILAVVGYSVNDTIVVFDRIRENFRKVRRGQAIDVVNMSVNETLSRTVLTSAVTMLVVLAMLFFGGETLRGFSLALTIGIVVGTFSSIYVASSLALALGATPVDLMEGKKKDAEVDSLP
jgi:preprotein translocase subunit SecF